MDIVINVSNVGETEEINSMIERFVDALKKRGVTVISYTVLPKPKEEVYNGRGRNVRE